MKRFVLLLALASVASATPTAQAVDNLPAFEGPGDPRNFVCPEKNGKFPDPEQCDLYYECVDNVAEPKYCPDGLMFDYSKRNHEVCKYPFDVSCTDEKYDRIYVQEPQEDRDPRCVRGNGFFDHEDPAVCDKFYSCDKGTLFEMPCVPSLFFDNGIGTCVREADLSETAKRCNTEDTELKTVDGFTCPGQPEVGSQGLLQQHPLYPHPTDCQFFFTCFYGKEPNKLGCPKGQVYDADSYVCKAAEEVADCKCWYDCGEDSRCPETCNTDCTCPEEA